MRGLKFREVEKFFLQAHITMRHDLVRVTRLQERQVLTKLNYIDSDAHSGYPYLQIVPMRFHKRLSSDSLIYQLQWLQTQTRSWVVCVRTLQGIPHTELKRIGFRSSTHYHDWPVSVDWRLSSRFPTFPFMSWTGISKSSPGSFCPPP